MRDNVLAQWVIAGLSVVAFILLLKFGAAHLPDQGIPGSLKKIVASI